MRRWIAREHSHLLKMIRNAMKSNWSRIFKIIRDWRVSPFSATMKWPSVPWKRFHRIYFSHALEPAVVYSIGTLPPIRYGISIGEFFNRWIDKKKTHLFGSCRCQLLCMQLQRCMSQRSTLATQWNAHEKLIFCSLFVSVRNVQTCIFFESFFFLEFDFDETNKRFLGVAPRPNVYF